MAIYKSIIAENAVPLSYHRVACLTKIKGVQNIIEVASYVSAEARAVEAEAIANQVAEQNVYIETSFINAPYDPEMTYTQAYEYIKGIEPYNDGDDVFDDSDDPIAIAISQAKDGVYDSELVLPKPADKLGFVTVPVIKCLGYRVAWEYVPDPEYATDEDGTYLKPFTFTPGMTVELGMWYTDGEDIWECIEAGVADAFTAPWFDVIEV